MLRFLFPVFEPVGLNPRTAFQDQAAISGEYTAYGAHNIWTFSDTMDGLLGIRSHSESRWGLLVETVQQMAKSAENITSYYPKLW